MLGRAGFADAKACLMCIVTNWYGHFPLPKLPLIHKCSRASENARAVTCNDPRGLRDEACLLNAHANTLRGVVVS